MTQPIDVCQGSPERLGYSWDHFSELSADQEAQFRAWTSFIDVADWAGKKFLDVVCGMGRNSYWPMSCGAASGLSIDVDERSLARARQNLAGYPNDEARFLSLYDIEEQGSFDIAFSIGVIHHLEHPELAPLRKLLFSRLPISWVRWLALIPPAALWLGKLEYFNQIRKFSFSHLCVIVFDQMLPKIAQYDRRAEAAQLMEAAKLDDIQPRHVNGISWQAIGTRWSGAI